MGELIGSQINVPGTRGKGILRYQGSIHGKTGIFAGIELLGSIALTRGKNCGDVEGFKYFEVQQPMTGLFLPFERLKTVNPGIEYSRDMFEEVSKCYGNDKLDEGIESTSFEEYDPSSVVSNGNVLYLPMPQDGKFASSNSAVQRSYSVDIPKTRAMNNLSPLLNSRRTTQFSQLDGRSRTSSMSSFTRSPILNTAYRSVSYHSPVPGSRSSTQFLEQELLDLRGKYEKNEREMAEKMSILNELKDTVQELQPILKQYENELDERDRKISKVRSEFEAAREDWRQNIDIMVSTYESNENFYESKIRELQKKLSEQSPSKELLETKQKHDEIMKEKIEMENAFNIQIKELESKLSVDTTKELNRKILEQQKEIEQLSSQIMEIHKFPADNQDQLQDKIFKLEAEIESLAHLKPQIEQLETEKCELQKQMERNLSFEKLEDKNTELNKLQDIINDLKEQLANKDKEIIELEDSLDAKVKELSNVSSGPGDAELKEDLMFKDEEIKALQQQLDKLNETIAGQKKRIKDMELKSKDAGEVAAENGTAGDEANDEIIYLKSELTEKDKVIQELERKLQASITNELDSLNINDAAVMNEMVFKKEIDDLAQQLEARPTIEELAELQDKIDEMVRIHNNEIFFKQEELQRITAENNKLHTRLERALEGSLMNNRISEISHDSISVHSLPIYKPETDMDPSAGKDNWCGLCERDGHSSMNCPYENDIF